MTMRIPKSFLAVTVVFCFFAFQSCKKNDGQAPPTGPVIMPDTLTAGWSKTIVQATNLSDIVFNSSTTGYLVGSKIYKSTDGGNTWIEVSGISGLYNIFITNDSKAFFVGQYNAIYKTVDGGSNFTNTTIAATTYDVFFTGNTNGYCVAQDGLYNTTDAGVTWVKLATTGLPVTTNYSTLSFVNNTTGWVLLAGGIYKTNGSNLNWQQALVNGNTQTTGFGSVYATSASNVYVSNYGGQIFKSTDGGVNFSLIKQLNESGYADLHFLTDLIGYVSVGRHIYKTTDGGLNWAKVVTLGQGSITEIHFTDATHGWACGSDGVVLLFRQ